MLTLRTSPDIGTIAPTIGQPINSGGSVTLWQYDSTTGLLTGKFHDHKAGNLTDGPTYAHTAADRLKTRTWKRGVTTDYYYNQGGQLRAIDYSDATPDVLYNPDRLGRIQSVSQGAATVADNTPAVGEGGITFAATPVRQATYYYHPESFLLTGEQLVQGVSRTINRHYDSTGRPLSLDVGPEYSTALGYDSAGRINRVWDHPGLNGDGTPSAPDADFTYGYLPNSGGLIRTVAGPAHAVSNTWEPTRDVLAAKVNSISDTSVPSSFAYGVNAIGQRESVGPVRDQDENPVSIHNPAWIWDYNDRGELVSANDTTSTDRDRGYLYDKIGNRLATGGVYSVSAEGVESVTDPVTYTPNSLNQYSVANGVPLPAAAHDQDGNLRFDGGVNKASESREYLWDAENRLVEVRTTSDSPVTLATYEYDHLSRMVVRTAGDGATCYLYDGWNRLAEYSQDATGQVLKRSYVWGMDLSGTMQGAGGVGGLLAVSEHDAATGAVTQTYYPAFDGNGNITEYIDSGEFIVAHFEYDPFGNLVVDSEGNAATFPYRFSTKPEDPVTGLYYYGYRWLDPLTGRWPSRDPIEEDGGLNLYGFVGNDGADWIDVMGLEINPSDPRWNGLTGGNCMRCHIDTAWLDRSMQTQASNVHVSGPSLLEVIKSALPGREGCFGPLSYTLVWVPYPGGKWDVTFNLSGCIEKCCNKKTSKEGLRFKGEASGSTALSVGYGAGGNRGLKRDPRINNKTKLRGEKGRFAKNPEKGKTSSGADYSVKKEMEECETTIEGFVIIEVGGRVGAFATANPYANVEFKIADKTDFSVDYGARFGVSSYIGAELYIEAEIGARGTLMIEDPVLLAK